MSNPCIQLAVHVSTIKGLKARLDWIQSVVNSQRPTTPFQSLAQTVTFRLLASDITQSLTIEASLPSDIANPEVQERSLSGSIPVQVLGVEDISKSRWEQIEAIEAIERGEGTRGREIIRVTEEDDGTNGNSTTRKPGMHRLLLQDAKGTKVYGLEVQPLDAVGLGMNIGTKLLLQDAIAARGVILMDSNCTKLLGGKIEAFHKIWKETRKADLQRGIEEQTRGERSN